MAEQLDIIELGVPADFPYGGSRKGAEIDTIVYHFTEGYRDDPRAVANTWIKPSRSAPPDQKWGREASAHYINPREGQIARFMPEEWSAWHTPGCNARSIGIENCAYLGETLTPSQEARLVALTKDIMGRYKIKRITGHRFASSKGVGSTNCPGDIFGVRPEGPESVQVAAQKAFLAAFITKHFGPELAAAI